MPGWTRAVGESFGLAAPGDIEEAVSLKLVADTPRLAATIESRAGWVVIYITQIDVEIMRAFVRLRRACVVSRYCSSWWTSGPRALTAMTRRSQR